MDVKTAAGPIGHLGQVFDTDRHQRFQVGDAMPGRQLTCRQAGALNCPTDRRCYPPVLVKFNRHDRLAVGVPVRLHELSA